MSELKPTYKKDSVTITANGELKATLLCDLKRYRNGSMLMTLSDTHLMVKDDNDNDIGAVGIAIGGTMYVYCGSGNDQRIWKLDPLQIFEMVRQAEKEQYLAKDIHISE